MKKQERTLLVQPFDEASALGHESAEGQSALSLGTVSSWSGVNAKRVPARACVAILSSESSGHGRISVFNQTTNISQGGTL